MFKSSLFLCYLVVFICLSIHLYRLGILFNRVWFRYTLYKKGKCMSTIITTKLCGIIWRTSYRITSAHAGTTYIHTVKDQIGRDHPRSRGYYYKCRWNTCAFTGSPPLTRVLQPFKNFFHLSVRITPAHAGTTSEISSLVCQFWDHPRSRGYYKLYYQLQHLQPGSPPLTRVLRQSKVLDSYRSRIPPAHAGTTLHFYTYIFRNWDHPRSRGYYTVSTSSSVPYLGSPPLTRVLR